MNSLKSYNFSTSPLSQPTRKLRRLENPTLRSREPKVRRLSEVYRRNLIKKYSGISEVKELDAETGLYYYGARYLDPRTSRWLSGDPAIYEGDYLPSAPINDEARKRNQNLPGMGGIFNHVNMHVYHYGGNNPVKYVDPDGRAAGDEFATIEEAAIDFAVTYNDDSIRDRREYGSTIYRLPNGSYTYTIPRRGRFDRVTPSRPPRGYRVVATIHTHGAYVRNYDGENFSVKDRDSARRENIPSYLVTPSGRLRVYDPRISGSLAYYDIETYDIPSDPNTGSRRVNNIDPGDGADDPFIGIGSRSRSRSISR